MGQVMVVMVVEGVLRKKNNFGTDAKQLGYNGFPITQISDGRDLKY